MGLRTTHNAKLPIHLDLQVEVDSLRDLLRSTINDLIETQDKLNKAEARIEQLKKSLLEKQAQEPVNLLEL